MQVGLYKDQPLVVKETFGFWFVYCDRLCSCV